jgi:hypothetical protein
MRQLSPFARAASAIAARRSLRLGRARAFRLVHEEAMGECRGSTDYITTWRAEVVR